jgi:hypothetical protein
MRYGAGDRVNAYTVHGEIDPEMDSSLNVTAQVTRVTLKSATTLFTGMMTLGVATLAL